MKIDKEVYIEIARDLADASDEEQCAFLNEFFKALRANCGDEYRTQLQIISIWDGLYIETKERINFMGE